MQATTRLNPSMPVAGCILLAVTLACAGCAATPDWEGSAAASAAPDAAAHAQGAVSLPLARAARQGGDLASAIEVYRTIAQGPTGKPANSVELGDTLMEAGQYDDAIEAYEKAQNSPARLGALLGLMRAYVALGEAATALSYADQAASLAPGDARVLVDRGATLDVLRRHAEAQALYRAVLASAPHNVAARNDLALSLALTGEFAPALRLIAPLARSAAATPKIRENLALILGLSGDDARAATVSRMDLDEASTADNLTFFAQAREAKP